MISPIGKRLASRQERGRLYLTLGGDAMFRPQCLLASVVMRLSPLEQALQPEPMVKAGRSKRARCSLTDLLPKPDEPLVGSLATS